MRQIPANASFETGSFKGCRAFAWKYAEAGPWPVSIDLWWQRLDNKQMEVLSAVLLCAERHNKEHVSRQYSAYKMSWRDYPVRRKSLVCPCLLHWFFWLTWSKKHFPVLSCSEKSYGLCRLFKKLALPDARGSLLNTPCFLLFKAFRTMLWH